MKLFHSVMSIIAMLVAALIPAHQALAKANNNKNLTKKAFNRIVSQGVPTNALNKAIDGYEDAINHGKVKNKRYLTVVDFDQPSTAKRLYVIDLVKNKVVYNEYVAHGQGSGANQATYFSNKQGSHASELGTIVTANIYYGKHGQSLRLKGTETDNANIRSRAIVVHAANYASKDFIAAHNRLGRSWGCFALDPEVAPEIMNTIKNGSVIYAYSSHEMQTA